MVRNGGSKIRYPALRCSWRSHESQRKKRACAREGDNFFLFLQHIQRVLIRRFCSAEESGKQTEREHFSAELKRIKENCEREKADLKRVHQLELDEMHARLHASEKLTRAIDTVEQTAHRVNELSRSVSSQRQGSMESLDVAMKARERAILQSEEKIARDMQFIETERARIEELANHVRELTAENRRHANEDKTRSSRDSSRLDSLVASLEAVRCACADVSANDTECDRFSGTRRIERARVERDAPSRRNTRSVLPVARVCIGRCCGRTQGSKRSICKSAHVAPLIQL